MVFSFIGRCYIVLECVAMSHKGGGRCALTGGPFMLIFMQAVRLFPCSLINTQRVNEVYFCIIFTNKKYVVAKEAGLC